MPDIEKAMDWARRNSLLDKGVFISSRKRICYPEVTGYFIPTLLSLREDEMAMGFARWLCTQQNKDGSFNGSDGIPHIFDTGQVVRGFVAILDKMPEIEDPLRSACEYILREMDPSGRLNLPRNLGAWVIPGRGVISEGVYLYVLPALYAAGEKLEERRYRLRALRSRDYYLRLPEIIDFKRLNMLTHLYGYIQEALCQLDAYELASRGMKAVEPYLDEDGAVPGYHDVKWVCSPGLAQLSITWSLLGDYERARKSLSLLRGLQNESGGFFGSYGQGADYFPEEEISWAVKFYLDALLLEGEEETKSENDQKERISLNEDQWADAIVGGTTPAQVAHQALQNSPSWLAPLLKLSEPSQRILELGSGTGGLSVALAKAGRKVTLLDFSSGALYFSREVFLSVGACAEFIQADVRKRLPFNDNYFDLVFSSGLLEHMEDEEIQMVIDESARVSCAWVISLVPNGASIFYRLGKWYQEKAGQWRWGKEREIYTLRPFFERSGLVNISEETIDPIHSLRFLTFPGVETVKGIAELWFEELSDKEVLDLKQGYLLLTIGEKKRG